LYDSYSIRKNQTLSIQLKFENTISFYRIVRINKSKDWFYSIKICPSIFIYTLLKSLKVKRKQKLKIPLPTGHDLNTNY